MITITDHLTIARRYAANLDEWPFAPRFDPHQRWYRRLAAEDDVEVWLLTWLPGQGTDLHDHGGSAGGLTVVSGELTEHTVTDPGLTARTFTAGDGRRFGPRHIHQITNQSGRPAVSVHVYSPRLTVMTRYRLVDDRVIVTAVDRAGAQW